MLLLDVTIVNVALPSIERDEGGLLESTIGKESTMSRRTELSAAKASTATSLRTAAPATRPLVRTQATERPNDADLRRPLESGQHGRLGPRAGERCLPP